VLKILARDLKLPILALSQMNRESEKGSGNAREPKLSDLRGSGSIEQDADAVFFIHRVEDGGDEAPGHDRENARKIKIILAKNRFGPTGGADMLFFPATMRFTLAATPHQQEHREAEEPRVAPRKQASAPPGDDEDMF
jgi:replicative DNA helicase